MKKLLLLLILCTFIIGCDNKEEVETDHSTSEATIEMTTQTLEDTLAEISTTLEATTEEIIIAETTEEVTTVVDTTPLSDGIYTSTEIINWSSPVKPAEKGLKRIIKILQDKKEYYDAIEYLFYVENISHNPEEYHVRVIQNFSDQQIEVGNFILHGEDVETQN
ncbi:hypothetical protein [Globicatella sanguinis]|uniref:hypothetical protein n=1 Tax=Globicatella sanguinis TaxID=13076 RepID=UPI00082624EE|nr:hypothetical protein [Globicatella sanguinis]MDK7630742.1 hypothetical protein [Globicatella sanguinis]WIK66813.1 hypothetical protein CYJ72_001515 [Globicatella sanguinis]WKT56218.1 hypothetical protein Q3C38_01515 [Globicatella sanguinis]